MSNRSATSSGGSWETTDFAESSSTSGHQTFTTVGHDVAAEGVEVVAIERKLGTTAPSKPIEIVEEEMKSAYTSAPIIGHYGSSNNDVSEHRIGTASTSRTDIPVVSTSNTEHVTTVQSAEASDRSSVRTLVTTDPRGSTSVTDKTSSSAASSSLASSTATARTSLGKTSSSPTSASPKSKISTTDQTRMSSNSNQLFPYHRPLLTTGADVNLLDLNHLPMLTTAKIVSSQGSLANADSPSIASSTNVIYVPAEQGLNGVHTCFTEQWLFFIILFACSSIKR